MVYYFVPVLLNHLEVILTEFSEYMVSAQKASALQVYNAEVFPKIF